MTLPQTEQLDQLSHAELVALVKALIAENLALRAEVEKLRQPPPTSRNSSQPPSRDQKANPPSDRPRKKHGPPFGHQRHARPLLAHPDRVITAPVRACAHCRHDLREAVPERVIRRQVTELPACRPVVIETQQHLVRCPHCRKLQRGALPPGLSAERCFGPRLEALVVYLKGQQHLSYARLTETLRDWCGLRLSEGAVAQILARAGERARVAVTAITEQLRSSAIVRSDETSARVAGRTHWQWVFIGEQAVWHQIVPRRNAAVIAAAMGEQVAGVWVSDCFSAQLKAPARAFQLCLAHQPRDLQRVLDAHPRCRWAAAIQALLREAIHLRNRAFVAGEPLTLRGYLRRVTQLNRRLDLLLRGKPASQAARRLWARFREHRDKLLVFLDYPDVPATNNESERALRTSVIHRKVTNGFRSAWGAEAYAALQSVVATARRKGEQVFDTLVNLLGPPVLPFLTASPP